MPVSNPLFDTMLASRLLEAGKGRIGFRLDQVVERYLGVLMSKAQQKSDWGSLSLSADQVLYAARDAAVLLPLRNALLQKIERAELEEVADLEFRTVQPVAEMELTGLGVDWEKWQALADELRENEKEVLQKLRTELKLSEDQEVNLNSQPQILQLLRALGVPNPEGRGLISDTNDWTLSKLAQQYPAVQALREHRKVTKAISAFAEKLPQHINKQTGRIHPNFNQYGAESGRFSCDSPNLQQIPRDRKFRSCFVPKKGYKFAIADFSQIELRIAADISGDKTMTEAYASGGDLHRVTAALVTGKKLEDVQKADRQLAKAVNFGLIYGMSPNRFKDYAESSYGVKMSQEEANKFHRAYFDHYTGITEWHNHAKKRRPRETRTRSRRRAVFDSFAFTKALNYPVQGTSADITKESLARLPGELREAGIDGKVVMCVHDEIIIEIPEEKSEEALNLLVRVMEQAGERYLLNIPCIAEGAVGESWADKP